ncbi:Down syndrome cell adhesion molecule-like protein Dscam2 [Limulus polyphemus]|uniref:Down syndrome cell adhesion molecule-like protein Dscam2 n=1 Tax=Limulus polyphemus TaxID=6850 RepID=A0ABM1BUK6_LIMPO|nr:Down syndrome cell adhesion molecule-like protein Dscam2 [Limulus polyphemus]
MMASWKCSFCLLVLQRILDLLLMNAAILFVAKAQVPLKIRPFKLPETVEEGKKVQIVCGLEEGDGNVRFTWFKNGAPIVSDIRWTVVTHATFSVLEMDGVKVVHSGNYTCVASNSVGKDSHTAVLSVQGPPTWKDEPSDVEVAVGESVVIRCSAYGSPAPSVVWTKNSERSSDSTKKDLQRSVDKEGTLRLEDVQRNDEGYYTCSLKNGIGNPLQKTVEIRIKGNQCTV